MSSLLFGNGTDIVHWKPSPNTRGTFDILSTCIITMLLCVWTAVHLNIPPPGSVWKPRLRKVGWLILALLAPEMVAYTAWYQRQEANSVMHVVNSAYNLKNPPSLNQKTYEGVKKVVSWFQQAFVPSKKGPARQPTLESQKSSYEERHPWTLAHGFYARMGGIAFEVPENLPKTKRFLPSHAKETWFVTGWGIESLVAKEAGRDVIPNLSVEEIKSRSKANSLAKALVCIQALWFIAQCITRLAQRIPISLLELNTFGHAVCALLIYLLWWEKPFEVDYPTMIESQLLWDLRALHWMHWNRSAAVKSYYDRLETCLESDQWVQTLAENDRHRFRRLLHNRKDISVSYGYWYLDSQDEADSEDNSTQGTRENEDSEVSSNILAPGQTLQGTGFKTAPDLRSLVGELAYELLQSFDSYSGSHPAPPALSLTTEDVTRYRMAWHAQEFMGSYHISGALNQRCKNWPDIDDMSELPIAIGFTTVALVYGGLHALAWFAHFDSPTEQLLWRISACVVMGAFPVFLALLKAAIYLPNGYYIDTVIEYAAYFVLLPYVLARAFLVVECFINLSHLPAGVYDVPQWATYFPHIS